LCLNLNGCRPLMGLELLWAELVPQKSHDHKGCARTTTGETLSEAK